MLLVADEMLSGLRECEFQEALGGLPSSFRAARSELPANASVKRAASAESSCLRTLRFALQELVKTSPVLRIGGEPEEV